MSESSSLQDRVVRLEELFSHQQHLVQQLNDVVIQLRSDVETLVKKSSRHSARLQELADKQSAMDDLPDEKPPHY